MRTAEEIAESVYPENHGAFTAHLKQLLKADIEDYAQSVAKEWVKAAIEDLPTLSDIISDKYVSQLFNTVGSGKVVIVDNNISKDQSALLEAITRLPMTVEHLIKCAEPITVLPIQRESIKSDKVDKIPCPKPYRKRGY